ncbi:MAG TPA: multidrug efflux RND transporter permease subunit [Gemmataceae bacterium]|nr:multidrug efflux RND transporter permease subunit [Gemmataceae bacterium]
MFSRFFIQRPIFAAVLSIIITLGGGIAVFTLPIAQYPDITPPTVEVSAVYPGANAKVVADTIAAPIEQQVNGVEGMMYMSSQCTNDGTYTLTVTFRMGSNINMAQILVQNRVAMAQPVLPDLVQRRGVSVKKKSPSILMIVNLFSPDGSLNALDLSNYATIQLRDELSRLSGVGDITYLGQRDYSMRIWLDPRKLTSRNLSAGDVVATIQQQNIQVAAGQIGQPPAPKGQEFQYTLTTLGRLVDEKQFGNMVLKAATAPPTNTTSVLPQPPGIVLMRDVARIELGAQSYDQTCSLDGKPSVALSVYQLPGSNALKTADLVRAKMSELRERFPEGLDYAIVYDTTPFIRESITEVFRTLRDAVLLVAFVVLLFLQSWRSAIIPLIAVPVAIVGTFAVMVAFGFSLNNLTLFGLVLAIGIVVDDAIVVVEAIERQIEEGLEPREAAIKAMSLVSGPVIAIGLVLSAVFVPCAFIAGIEGQFFRQFALTIAVSTLISAFNSLTLSPALAALLLRKRDKADGNVAQRVVLPRIGYALLGGWLGWVIASMILDWAVPPSEEQPRTWMLELSPLVGVVVFAVVGWFASSPLNWLLGNAFHWFNVGFERVTGWYVRAVGGLLRISAIVIVVYGGLLGLTVFGFLKAPTGFIPEQDQGFLLVNLQMPDAWSLERTEQTMRVLEETARKTAGVKHTVAIAGQSMLLNANAPNYGSMYVMLDDFDKRNSSDLSADTISASLQSSMQKATRDGVVNLFSAPPIAGLGTAGGFRIILEDRGELGMDSLQKTSEKIIACGERTQQLTGMFTSLRADTPWLNLDIDRVQAKSRGVSIGELFTTLQVNLGSLYVNDFNRFGRTWQVNVQATDAYRMQIKELVNIQVRNTDNKMIPLTELMSVSEVPGPNLIARYNMYPDTAINGTPTAGTSSGDAIRLMEQITRKELEKSMRLEWTELAFLQLQTGNTALWVFLLAVVLVFLVLAAQYESWSLPLAVILVVPMCLLCSIVGVTIARMDVNIFTQIGYVVLIGLACKNAILIVEYAKAQHDEGKSPYDATLEAVKLRLRPIVMTSFAFILGVVPLILSHGAGAEMRRILGIAVFSGMLGVTAFGVFLTPVFYYAIQFLNDRWFRSDKTDSHVEMEPEENTLPS